MKRSLMHAKLMQPVDAASLVFFRVALGILLLVDVLRYGLSGNLEKNLIDPPFLFKYYGFEWVQVWPGDGLYWHFAVMGVLAVMIITGAFYRLAITLFFFAFAYLFLLEQALYLNHFYLVLTIILLMIFVPAHRSFSIDAWRRPALRSPTVPRWSIWALRFQIEIVLIYAGLVKLNPDWLQLQPLTLWWTKREHLAVFGPLLAQDWAVAASAYGVILLHLVGAPLLLWRKTRFWVFVVYVVFHLTNHFVFTIGIFPWLTIAGTLLFFEPDWPRQVGRRLRSGVLRLLRSRRRTGLARRADESVLRPTASGNDTPAAGGRTRLVSAFLAVFFAFQILFPLRHLLYPGDVAWTEEGHRFAWRMKLRDKQGWAVFRVTDPANGRIWRVDPRGYLTARQYVKMVGRPDMILQFAHYLAVLWEREKGITDPEVRAIVWCSLNGRRSAPLIDPERDLAKVERSLLPADWILPLREPLRRSGGVVRQAATDQTDR